MSDYILQSYNIVNAVYRQGAYVSIALSNLLPSLSQADKSAVTRIAYGVIEHHEEFSYMLKKLCKKPPKAVIRVILRVGMYLIKYMDSVPDYAAVNETVELTRALGKKDNTAFVNSVLKKYIATKDSLPEGFERVAIDNNIPLWLAKRYIADHGETEGMRIICSRPSRLTHIRNNNRCLSKDALEKALKGKGIKYKSTEHGFLVGATDGIANYIDRGKATVQALCSIIVCRALTPAPIKGKILDMCAAPGGKAVYLSEINPDAAVLALDVHPHRVELIKSYARRMLAGNVIAEQYDGTFVNTDWLDAFEAVLVDAPCSGMGVRGSNPDIILNKSEEDILALAELQYKLLSAAAKYVSKDGALVYSTCSDIIAENEQVVTRFLLSNPEFSLQRADIAEDNNGMYGYSNDEEGHEGFFLARMVRRNETAG